MDHAEQIKKAMELREVDAKSLAKYSGVPLHSVYAILEKRRVMTVLNAKRIARALKNVTARELLIAQVDYQLKIQEKWV